VVKKATYWDIHQGKEVEGQVENRSRTAKGIYWKAPVMKWASSVKRQLEGEGLLEKECSMIVSIDDPMKAVHA
jgi:hypothetical protein